MVKEKLGKMKKDERIPVVHDNCVLIQPVVHTNLKIYVLPINPNGYVNGIRNCLDTNLKEIRKHHKFKKIFSLKSCR